MYVDGNIQHVLTVPAISHCFDIVFLFFRIFLSYTYGDSLIFTVSLLRDRHP